MRKKFLRVGCSLCVSPTIKLKIKQTKPPKDWGVVQVVGRALAQKMQAHEFIPSTTKEKKKSKKTNECIH
jgi:hypothetical protein